MIRLYWHEVGKSLGQTGSCDHQTPHDESVGETLVAWHMFPHIPSFTCQNLAKELGHNELSACGSEVVSINLVDMFRSPRLHEKDDLISSFNKLLCLEERFLNKYFQRTFISPSGTVAKFAPQFQFIFQPHNT